MKRTRMLLCVAMLAMLSLPARAMNDKDAEKAAYLHVPAEAVLEKVEWDDGFYEVDFFVKETQERYEVRVHPESGKVVSMESERRAASKEAGDKIGETAAGEIVKNAYSGAEILQTDERIDDGRAYYAVFFAADGCYGTLEIGAYTGDVLEREIYFGAYAEDGMLSQEQAEEKVRAYKPGAQINTIRKEKDDGTYVWEGSAQVDGRRYEFTINAVTGEMMEWERD